MKRAWLVLLCTGFSACINFDDELRAWCADAGPGVCDVLNDDAGTGDGGVTTDAGFDAGVDEDAGFDAGVDEDAGFDAGVDEDAGFDAGVDEDAGFDAGPGADDAGVDGGFDAGVPDAGQPDAGPGDAGPADAGFTIGPVCLGNWCWQNPAFPPATLYAVWGSSDNDVYAAGSGGMVFHYDGGSWGFAQPISVELTRWAVITSGVRSAAGVNWMCGPDVGAFWFNAQPGPVGYAYSDCSSVAEYGGQLAFAAAYLSNNPRIGANFSSAIEFTIPDRGLPTTRRDQIGLGANDEWATIDQSDGPAQWVMTPYGAAPGVLGIADFDYSFAPRALRVGPQGRLHMLASGGLNGSYRTEHDGGAWFGRTIEINGNPTQFDDMLFHDGTWWYSGGGQLAVDEPAGGARLLLQQPDLVNTALWSSGPSLWMVGTNGQAFKVTGATSADVQRMTPPAQPKIYDVVVKGPPETWRAFGERGATWQHVSGRWELQPGTADDDDTVLAADWLPDAGYFLLRRDGRVQLPSGVAQLPVPGRIEKLSSFDRPHGAIKALGPTQVWAAAGNRVARVLVDGGVPYVAFSATLPMSHATGLVVYEPTPENFVVHVSLTQEQSGAVTDGGVYGYLVVANQQSDAGYLVAPGEPVYSLEHSVGDSSYALTASRVLNCTGAASASCGDCIVLPEEGEMQSYQRLIPLSLSVTSQRLALVDTVGRVYDDTLAGFCSGLVADSIPWPRGKNISNEPMPMRIKRNGTRLFVVGERGSILSRP